MPETIQYAEVASAEGWTSWFVSTDGDRFIEVDRCPEAGEALTIRRLLAGQDPETGEQGKTFPMAATKRYIDTLIYADWVESVEWGTV